MLVSLSYGDLLLITSALETFSAVYGNAGADDLAKTFDDLMSIMDNAPITEVYPDLCRDVGTVST